MKTICGIDPGKSGAIAVIDGSGVVVETFVDSSIGNTIKDVLTGRDGVYVYLEKVHSFPNQGVSSSFAFGRAFGEIIGCLDALEIPYEFVSPQKWQKGLGLPKKKDGATEHKRALKILAQQRFPKQKPTLKTADALLIADYGRKR